jgi:hypothetical protein
MDPVSIKYNIILHCKTLQNLPKFGFLVCFQTIWQPWTKRLKCMFCLVFFTAGYNWILNALLTIPHFFVSKPASDIFLIRKYADAKGPIFQVCKKVVSIFAQFCFLSFAFVTSPLGGPKIFDKIFMTTLFTNLHLTLTVLPTRNKILRLQNLQLQRQRCGKLERYKFQSR